MVYARAIGKLDCAARSFGPSICVSGALREPCGDVSPAVLEARVNELRKARFAALDTPGGYRLTALGRELLESTNALYSFAERRAKAERG